MQSCFLPLKIYSVCNPMEIFKILGVCLVAAILCVILKQHKSEYALLVSVAAGILLLGLMLKNIFSPLQSLYGKIEDLGVETEYFKVAIKALGIGYITTFIADTCRESGQAALASKAELAGKGAIFLLSVPIALSILETAIGFIK